MIQFTDKTEEMFSALGNTIFENVDELELTFSTDSDDHRSVDTIASKLALCQNLHVLKITIFINSHVGRLFRLIKDSDSEIFKKVKTLEVIVHEDVKGSEDVEKFIG